MPGVAPTGPLVPRPHQTPGHALLPRHLAEPELPLQPERLLRLVAEKGPLVRRRPGSKHALPPGARPPRPEPVHHGRHRQTPVRERAQEIFLELEGGHDPRRPGNAALRVDQGEQEQSLLPAGEARRVRLYQLPHALSPIELHHMRHGQHEESALVHGGEVFVGRAEAGRAVGRAFAAHGAGLADFAHQRGSRLQLHRGRDRFAVPAARPRVAQRGVAAEPGRLRAGRGTVPLDGGDYQYHPS